MRRLPSLLRPIGSGPSLVELLVFVYPAAVFFKPALPSLSTNAGVALSTILTVIWIAALAAFVHILRLANFPGNDLHVVFTRYLMAITLSVFLAVRVLRCFLFGPERSALAWPTALAALFIVIVAVLLLPRLSSFQESAALARLEHARFLAAAECMLDDFYIFDGVYDSSGDIRDFRFAYINPNAERRLHVRRDDLIGKILTEERPFMISSGLIHKYREVVRTGVPYITEVFIDDERIKATWLNVQVVKLGTGIAITSRDVTEMRRSAERIHHLAHYDQLTGLPNRTLLEDRLQQALLHAERYGEKLAILMVDIDNFKRINDTLGHSTGDTLLAAVAERLRASVRDSDTVARLGGDEFVILMPEFQNTDEIRRRGDTILRNVSQPILVGDLRVSMTISVGAAIYPHAGLNLHDLLKSADRAMYGIKDSGRNGFNMFNPHDVHTMTFSQAGRTGHA